MVATRRESPCILDQPPYSGCNVILLWMAQAPGYRRAICTVQQALELGANVRKCEHGTKVIS